MNLLHASTAIPEGTEPVAKLGTEE
jgi:hypothetical protein